MGIAKTLIFLSRAACPVIFCFSSSFAQLVPAPRKCVKNSVELPVFLENQSITGSLITWWARKKQGGENQKFTLISMPDTQYYVAEKAGGKAGMMYAQTDWIARNRLDRNIVFVGQLGDCVESANVTLEWERADTAFRMIEDPDLTALREGIPYGICVGNHDQFPVGEVGSTSLFNQYFGVDRFWGRTYYGGHQGKKNDNSFVNFEGGGLEFMAVFLEYDEYGVNTHKALAWADSLLTANAHKRAIVISHSMLKSDGSFTNPGLRIVDELSDHPNLFLMLCGHNNGQFHKTIPRAGMPDLNILLADFQFGENGGNGWMEILEFDPLSDSVRVSTYSPWLDAFRHNESGSFSFYYKMGNPFTIVGDTHVLGSAQKIKLSWEDFEPGMEYEWYATISGVQGGMVRTPIQSFTTAEALVIEDRQQLCHGQPIELLHHDKVTRAVWVESQKEVDFSNTLEKGRMSLTLMDQQNCQHLGTTEIVRSDRVALPEIGLIRLDSLYSVEEYDDYFWFRESTLIQSGSQGLRIGEEGRYRLLVRTGQCYSDTSEIDLEPVRGARLARGDVRIYPNPANQWIRMVSFDAELPEKLELYDPSGSHSWELKISPTGIIELPGDLAPGNYIYRFGLMNRISSGILKINR